MGQITIDQSHQVMAVLATNANWEEIDFTISGLQDAVIRDPQEAGRRFTKFLKQGCWLGMKSISTKPFKPAEFLGEGWTVWKGPANGDGLSGEEDIDSRSLALSQIEIDKFLFEACLLEGESHITGEEKLRRLKAKPNFIRFGGNVFLGLWEDYQANKENSVLEWLYKNRGIKYLDFPGLILRSPDGDRDVLYLGRRDDGRWDWICRWLGGGWSADDLSTGCAS
jgi:hypothetical protein